MRSFHRYLGRARFLKKEVRATESSDVGVKYISGFASMEGVDRQGDDINPNLFDLKTFLSGVEKAGAVYVNHTLWRTPEGNEVSAGVVREAYSAKVMASENESEYKIVDMKTGEQVDTIPRDDTQVVGEGDVGLWVKMEIMEPGVIKLIDQGRLNAFSWAGDMNKSGLIDLMEVSLVYVGANARALIYSKALDDVGPTYLVKSNGVYVEGTVGLEDDAFVLADVETSGPMYAVLKEHSHGDQEVYTLKAQHLDEAQWEFMELLQAGGFYGRVALLKNTLRRNEEGPVFEVLDDYTRKYAAKGAHWTEAYVNNLPDTAFAYIEKGGTVGVDDRTSPRSMRHFPIADHRGTLDRGRVRDALTVLKSHPFAGQAGIRLKAAAAELGLEFPDTSLEGGEIDMTNEQVEAAFKDMNDSIKGITEVLKSMQPVATEVASAEETEVVVEKTADAPAVEKAEVPTTSPEMLAVLDEVRSLKNEIASLKKAEAAPVVAKAMVSKAIVEPANDGIRERENIPLTAEERDRASSQALNEIFRPATRAGADAFAGSGF